MFHVYVLKNPKGKLYKGFTVNINKRLLQHNAANGFRSYTNNRGPWKLIYQETFENETEARMREKFFKSGQGRIFLNNQLGDYPPQADG